MLRFAQKNRNVVIYFYTRDFSSTSLFLCEVEHLRSSVWESLEAERRSNLFYCSIALRTEKSGKGSQIVKGYNSICSIWQAF